MKKIHYYSELFTSLLNAVAFPTTSALVACSAAHCKAGSATAPSSECASGIKNLGGAQGTQPEKTGECSEPMRGTASPRSAQAKSPACDHPSVKKCFEDPKCDFFPTQTPASLSQVLRTPFDVKCFARAKTPGLLMVGSHKKTIAFSANCRTPPSS